MLVSAVEWYYVWISDHIVVFMRYDRYRLLTSPYSGLFPNWNLVSTFNITIDIDSQSEGETATFHSVLTA